MNPPQLPRTGVKYVTGMPPQTPVLRPVRTRMYDREQVWGGHKRVQFFVDNRRTADGRLKDETFTNMWQSGQLGYPLIFDVASISISPLSSEPEYVDIYEKFIYSDYVLRWVFGAQTPWAEQPISLLRVRGPVDGIFFDKKTGKGYRVVVKDGKLEAVEVKNAEQTKMLVPDLGSRLITRYMDMTTPDRKARRIESTESFHGQIFREDGPSGKPIDVYLCMDGILYKQI